MITAVTVTAALVLVVLSTTELWAYAQKRFDLSARLLVAELAAIAVLLAVAIAARGWWYVALWALCTVLTVWNLRRTNRRRAAQTA